LPARTVGGSVRPARRSVPTGELRTDVSVSDVQSGATRAEERSQPGAPRAGGRNYSG